MESNQPSETTQISDYRIDDQALSGLSRQLGTVFQEIVSQEKLGEDIVNQFESIYLPLAAWIADKHSDHPIVIGINGAQGSGKSTLSKILKSLLVKGFGKAVLLLSIDDLYYSKDTRRQLAEAIHPLLSTRGVPGTHDVELGIKILDSVLSNTKEDVLLPVFDKSIDDQLSEEDWIQVNRPVDIILFEGWCVGSISVAEDNLLAAINDLEDKEDKNRLWRTYVNQQLAGPYEELFGYIDYLIMLQVPDMESILQWRTLQENKLKELCETQGSPINSIMTIDEIKRFIMYFERITRHSLEEMPDRADIVLKLNKNHQIFDVRVKN